jgi:hypothetical protein
LEAALVQAGQVIYNGRGRRIAAVIVYSPSVVNVWQQNKCASEMLQRQQTMKRRRSMKKIQPAVILSGAKNPPQLPHLHNPSWQQYPPHGAIRMV